ncbi:hypothetical protein JNL27_09675 [bacterium]|nr:hypothetical protein [bacterium]
MLIDLRELILLIKQNKEFDSHVCLDLGCSIEGHNAKPLVKTINYIINYLKEAGNGEIQIDLDSHHSKHQLVFIVHTGKQTLPPPSDQLQSIMNSYYGTIQWIFEPEKYAKCQLSFNAVDK